MAEESIDPLVAPEKIKLDVSNESPDTAKSSGSLNNGCSTHDRVRRTSISSANSIKNVAPRYLRASTGSCHDLCKYGGKHEFEEESRKPFWKRSPKPLHNETNAIQIVVSGEKRKENVVKVKPFKAGTNILHSPDLRPSRSTTPKYQKDQFVRQKFAADINDHPPKTKLSTDSASSAHTVEGENGQVDKQKSPADTNNHSLELKPSLDIKCDSPTPEDEKNMVIEQTSLGDVNNHTPDPRPCLDTKSDSPTPENQKDEVIEQKFVIDTDNSSRDLKMSPDTISDLPVLGDEKDKVVKHKPSARVNNRTPNLKPSPNAALHSPKPKRSLVAKTYSLRKNASSGDKNCLPNNKPFHLKKTPSPGLPENTKREVLLPSNKTEVPARMPKSRFFPDSKTSRTEKNTDCYADKYSSHSKSELVKGKHSSSGKSGGIHEEGEGNGRKITASRSSVRKALAPSVATLSPKFPRSKTPCGEARKAGNNSKAVNKSRGAETKTSDSEKVSEKTLHVIKMETANSVLESVSNGHVIPSLQSPSSLKSLSHVEASNSSQDGDGEETLYSSTEYEIFSDNKESTGMGKAQHMKENGRKTLRKSQKVVSRDNHRPLVKLKFRSGKVVNVHSDNKNIPRRLKFRRPRSMATDQVFSDNKETAGMGKVQHVKENQKRILRKSQMVVSEEHYRSPVKLKFRSRKIVDFQSDTNNNNNTPRRLKFRRARSLGPEESEADLRQRTLKNAEINSGEAGTELSPKKVSLKHQDVQGKKDTQGLFNNVIEETASKLAESRKSKVKALVGAFETVISLQEIKSSSKAVN